MEQTVKAALDEAAEKTESEALPVGEELDPGAVNADGGGEDYAAMADADLAEVKRLSPTLAGLTHLGAMPDAARFGELREMGLSVKEALGALGLVGKSENRGHLRSSVPRRVGSDSPRMTYGELAEAKRLFPDMEEREIARLYRRVNA